MAHVFKANERGGVINARFSGDGSLLATRGTDGAISLRDPLTYAVTRTLEGGTSANDNLSYGLHVSADAEFLLTTRDAKPRLWHVPSATIIGTFPHEAGLVANGNDYGDGLRLTSIVGDHVLVWNLDVDTWPEIACLAAGRNLTDAEWTQFGPRDHPNHATCAQWPADSASTATSG